MDNIIQFIAKSLERFKRYIHSNNDRFYHYTLGFFSSLLLIGLFYRLRILYLLKVDTGFSITQAPYTLLVMSLWNEFVFVLFAATLLWLFLKLISVVKDFEMRLWQRILLLGCINLVLFSVIFVYNSSYKFWVSLQTGFTWDYFKEGMATTNFSDFIKFIEWTDLLLIIIPLANFWLFLMSERITLWRGRILTAVFAFVILFRLAVGLFGTVSEGEIAGNPVVYTVKSIFKASGDSASVLHAKNAEVINEQMKSLRFIDSRFVHSTVEAKGRGTLRSGKRWNVIIVVMESIGYEYVFNTKLGNPMPMPFLHELSKTGLLLNNHYSCSNTSPRSMFSILSGINPSPTQKMFCIDPGIVIPALSNYLGKDYDSFLVTPGSLNWFFPLGFLKNAKINLFGYDDLPVPVRKEAYGKDEEETVDFFLKRLDKTKGKPFLGIYYSYVAHWPYIDYGPKYRIFKDIKNRLNRYYNNIYLLDCQIRKIYDYLKKNNLEENTILVVLGDHGEAFNQHKGNWVHSRASYNENVRVLALIHQPKLFSPKVIGFPTTHADIPPTLMEAMGIKFNHNLIQGESLLKERMRRKYVFFYGNEDTLSLVNMHNVKMQHSFKLNKCWVYDLPKDPREMNPLNCDNYPEQKKALTFYHQYQPKVLQEYNMVLKKGQDFYGEKHAANR